MVSLILIAILYFLYPINTKEDNKINTSKINVDAYIASFNFLGTMEHKIVFDNKYINAVFQNNGKIESHFLCTDTLKEVTFNDFIKIDKRNEFVLKETELLQLKYPKKIVDVLINLDKEYILYDDYIYIDYKSSLETERTFNLKMYYKEVYEYLNFSPIVNGNYQNETGFNYSNNKISVALTFDDGPNGKKTQTLIDALEDYKMSATFFMVGRKLNSDRNTVLYVSNSHSEIGYHSYNHAYMTKQSIKDIQDEFASANDMLRSITGKEFKLTRPPYGSYNKDIVSSINNAFILWNLDTNDWRYKDVEYIKNHVLDNLKDGDIILMHDAYQTSIDAALELIDILYMKDIQVLSISQLANLKKFDIENNKVYKRFS